jgi:ketosteroid isomerase-like protein
VGSNTQTVRTVQEAFQRGDVLATMSHYARDVRWTVHGDPDAAPWFGEYVGRHGVVDFFEALSVVDMEKFEIRGIDGSDNMVAAWLHVVMTSPKGRRIDMDELQIWCFDGPKVISVDLFVDTLEVARAFE